MKDPSEKVSTTFIYREDLDTNQYLEEMLIDESQNKILYMTMFVSLILMLINYLAW